MKMIGTIATTTTNNNNMDEMSIEEDSALFPTNDADSKNEEDDVASTSPSVETASTTATQHGRDDESGVEDDIEFLMPSIHHDKKLSKAPCPALTDALVAKQMSKLSVKDREEVYFDIHGVSGAIDEDIGFVESKLNELQHELERMDATNKKAYLMALSASPDYVQNRNLRLRFLRADRFDAKLAALRYVYNFEIKLELFGSDKLGRDIVQDDLDRESKDALYCDLHQMMPQRDSGGRAVFLCVANAREQSQSDRAAMSRCYYNSMLLTDDVETQRKGVVIVIYALTNGSDGKSNINNNNNSTKVAEGRKGNTSSSIDEFDWDRIQRQGTGRAWNVIGPMCRAVPLKIVGVHFCYNTLAWLPVLSTLRVASDLLWRLRFRAHRGSHSDCMYNLQTFGIPTGVFPIDENGQVATHSYRLLLEKRKRQEEGGGDGQSSKDDQSASTSNTVEGDDIPSSSSSLSTTHIALPCARDVLLGRGKGFFNHVGNVRYRGIIEDLQAKYDVSRRGVKKKMTHDVVRMIHELGGRFLKEDAVCGWVVVEEEVAALKVSHSFRASRHPSTRRSETTTTTTTTTTKHHRSTPSTTPHSSGGVAGSAKTDHHLRLTRTRAA